jgi:hypothetical protein
LAKARFVNFNGRELLLSTTGAAAALATVKKICRQYSWQIGFLDTLRIEGV